MLSVGEDRADELLVNGTMCMSVTCERAMDRHYTTLN